MSTTRMLGRAYIDAWKKPGQIYDMVKMAADPMTQKWWKETDPCQEPVDSAEEGVWWADMEEVYHLN